MPDSATRLRLPALACFALALSLLPGLADSTINLMPVADTSLFETSPNSNLGGNANLIVGTTASNFKDRGLIRFDLSAVPANATITSVALTLQVVKAAAGPGSTFALNRMLVAWNEGTGGGNQGAPANDGETTWANRVHPSTPWSSPGAGAGTDYLSAPSAAGFIDASGSYTLGSTADLVADVQAWLANPAANFGWILICQSEGTARTARRIASREDSLGSPVLAVQYTVPTSTTPPAISSGPSNQTVIAGATASFSVTVTGTGPLSYQWRFNNGNLPGETGSSLTLNNVQVSQAGEYSVVVTKTSGSVTSAVATLTVLVPPTLSNGPSNQTVIAGTTASFSVTVTGTAPLSYQWRFNNSSLPGETGSALTLNNVQSSQAGNYSVVVTNTAGSATSAVATLTVVRPPTITSLALIGNQLRFSFNAETNRTYAVEYRALSPTTDWSVLTNVAPLSAPASVAVSDQLTSSNRCYRVRVQ